MKGKFLKTAIVFGLTTVFVAIPATTASAWCGGGCYGYGYGGYGQGYTAPQYYAPTSTSTNTNTNRNTNSFDPTIYDMQVVLYEKGYYEGNIDGLLGTDTETALLNFQTDNNIPITENLDVTALKADTTTLEALGL